MAATRRQHTLEIFQDSTLPQDHHQVAHYEPHMIEAFGPVTNVSTDHHTLLEPPQVFTNAPSPQKIRHRSSSPPPSALAEKGLNTLSIPPPQEQNFRTDAPIKRAQRPIPQQSQVMANNRPPMFTHFQSQFDQENMYTSQGGFPVMSGMAAAEPPVKIGHKRALTDSAPLRDRSNKKQKASTKPPVEEELPLPDPEHMPQIEDDGTKPAASYAHLIGMAILRAPNRRMTLAQIYKWIAETFSFYGKLLDVGDNGWQNSIRHNLSLSKSFSKHERPKDDPGKGHYWVIEPGFEKQYHKAKATRRPTNPEGFLPAYPSDTGRPSTSSAGYPHPPLDMSQSIDSSKFPELTELSSDATIPCSDSGIHDGQDPDRPMPTQRQIPSSPPPANIHSSPPPAVSRVVREDTPPPPRVPRFPSNSRSGGRKRKFNGLGDSGYYSSIESSAIKGNLPGALLTSEADLDRPSIKRGRAEEEIARIRGSSYDSPTKTRTFMKQSNTRLTSSPMRAAKKPIDPLTPAIVFKRPALPPPSASPNTNLRNHRMRMRELVGGSPDKTMSVWVDNSYSLNTPNWSPAVTIPNEESVNLVENGFENTFDIFGDYVDYHESPLKRSAKRPRLERAATTSGILADITGSNASSSSNTASSFIPNWKSPFMNVPSLSPKRATSSSKPPTSNPLTEIPPIPRPEPGLPVGSHPFDGAAHDDDIFHLIHSDDSEPGIDLLQGFQKIGARPSVAPNGSPSKGSKGPRPSLARSSTNFF